MKSSIILALRDHDLDDSHRLAREAGIVTTWQITMGRHLHVSRDDWCNPWKGQGTPISLSGVAEGPGGNAPAPPPSPSLQWLPFYGVDLLHRCPHRHLPLWLSLLVPVILIFGAPVIFGHLLPCGVWRNAVASLVPRG